MGFTDNLNLELPESGVYGWGVPKLNPNFVKIDAAVGQLQEAVTVNGTATGGSSITLIDTSLDIGVDVFKDGSIVIYRGTVLLRAENIISNASNTITFASAAAIVEGDVYTLSTNKISDVETGTFTATGVGFVLATATWDYVIQNGVCTILARNLVGTSNSSFFQITGLPAACFPAQDTGGIRTYATDDGTLIDTSHLKITTAGAITVYSDVFSAVWISSGIKAMSGISSTAQTFSYVI